MLNLGEKVGVNLNDSAHDFSRITMHLKLFSASEFFLTAFSNSI